MTIWDLIGCAAIAAPAAVCLVLTASGALGAPLNRYRRALSDPRDKTEGAAR